MIPVVMLVNMDVVQMILNSKLMLMMIVKSPVKILLLDVVKIITHTKCQMMMNVANLLNSVVVMII